MNVNECDSNPCQNLGTCIDGRGEFTCICMPGKKATLCTLFEPWEVLTQSLLWGLGNCNWPCLVMGHNLDPYCEHCQVWRESSCQRAWQREMLTLKAPKQSCYTVFGPMISSNWPEGVVQILPSVRIKQSTSRWAEDEWCLFLWSWTNKGDIIYGRDLFLDTTNRK